MTLKFNRSGCEAITAAKVQVNQKNSAISGVSGLGLTTEMETDIF